MFTALVDYLLYPLHGQIVDSRICNFKTTTNFLEQILNTRPIEKTITNTNCIGYEINFPWKYSFFNWEKLIYSPSLVLHNLNVATSTLERSQNEVWNLDYNVNLINNQLPKIIAKFIKICPDSERGYVCTFGFWMLVELILIRNLNVSDSHIIRTLSIKNDLYNSFSEYNEISFALSILSWYKDLIVKCSDNRMYIKTPAFSANIILGDETDRYGLIGTDLNYSILWPLNNMYLNGDCFDYDKIVSNLCSFKNEIVAIHYFPTLEYEHYHFFSTIDEYIKYQLYNLYRTYRSQIILQNGSSKLNTARRLLYMTIASPTVDKYKNYIIREHGFLLNYLNILGGIPTDIGSLDLLPDTYDSLISYLNVRFVNKNRAIDRISRKIDETYQQKGYSHNQIFFIYDEMLKIISTVGAKTNFLNNFSMFDCPISASGNVNEVEEDVSKLIKLIDYPLGPPISLDNILMFPPDLENLINNLRFTNNSNLISWNKMYKLPLNDFKNDEVNQTDADRLFNFRSTNGIRNRLKFLQKESLDPEFIYNKIIKPNHYRQNLSNFDYLFFSVYALAATPVYSFNQNGDIEVVPIEFSDSLKFNKINSSSFKLLSFVFYACKLIGINEIVNKNSLLFLGAKEEPVVEMVSRMTHGKWTSQPIGADAVTPGKRADITAINLKASYDIIVSDMDQSIGDDVEGIVDRTLTQLKACINNFTKLLIFKIQYCLVGVLTEVRDLVNTLSIKMAGRNRKVNMMVYRHCWSKAGSLECFLIVHINSIVSKIPSNEEIIGMFNSYPVNNGTYIDFVYGGVPNTYTFDGLLGQILHCNVMGESFNNTLSVYSNLSNSVSYGVSTKTLSDRDGTLFCSTNIQRIGLFLRNKVVYSSQNVSGKEHMLTGLFNIQRDCVVPATRDVLFLSDAQRYMFYSGFKYLLAKYFNGNDLMVYDVGGRDYECAYLAVITDDKILPYTCIDQNDVVDVKRNITVRKQFVTVDEAIQFWKNGHVFLYNSLFMGFGTRVDLENALNKLVINDFSGIMFLSFYVMSEELKLFALVHGFLDNPNDCVAPDYCFSFGRYANVATVDNEFIENWIEQLKAQGVSVIEVTPRLSDLISSSVAHGYSVNTDALYLADFFYEVQKAYILVKISPTGTKYNLINVL